MMKLATQLNKIAPSLFGWAGFQTQWEIYFNSYAVKTKHGVVFVDPTLPEPAVLQQLEALGDPLAIVLTNAHHDRNADAFRKKYDVRVYAHERAQSDCDTKIDVLVLDGEKLPGGLQAIFLPGVTTSEMALYAKDAGGMLLIGDALMNTPGKGLQLLPDQFIEDKKLAKKSLQKLLEFDFKIATFGHGDPLTIDAKKTIVAFLKQPKR
jgi:glyoxylase-like metal-dependent hydrolase (beta-lactamase superfamily II)